MFARWLTCIAFLTSSINPRNQASGHGTVTFASTFRLKGQLQEELILHCGDGKHEGVVQFWHTPFGDLQSSGSRSNLDLVFMHHDGNLIIPNSSVHHSGLYYCILRHAEGSTLWPYELYVGPSIRNAEQGDGGRPARRFRRNAGSPGVREAVVSDAVFAGAVAASVLLTFVVGFSAGALSRTQVIRCLRTISGRLSPKQRRRQPDAQDGSRVTVTTLPPMYDNQTFKTGEQHRFSPVCRPTEAPAPLTTPSPPAKPKRSFRVKEEGAVYLEGCDYNQAEEEIKEECEGGAEEQEEASSLSCDPRENEGSQSEMEDGEASRETVDKRVEKDVAGEGSSRVEEMSGEDDEDDGGEKPEELEETSTGTDDDGSIENETPKDEAGEEEAPSCSPRRRSRVIRLYQYDEEGQRFGHLPDPAPEAPEPAPRLKQRSLSLTRLNAIMAAASTGPMESGKEHGEERPHFHMKI